MAKNGRGLGFQSCDWINFPQLKLTNEYHLPPPFEIIINLCFFQWQEDMQELLEDQMNRKMRAAQAQSKLKSGNDSDSSQATNERKKSKLFSFLKLGQT